MERNLSFAAAPYRRVRTKLTWAQLEIVSAASEEISLFIAGDDDSVTELRVEQEGEELCIAQPQLAYAKELLPRMRWLQICLRLPETYSGELDVDGISGMIGAHKISAGELSLTTVAGNLSADGLKGEGIKLHTVSGAISVEGLAAKSVHARTVSGRVKLCDASLETLRGFTVSGDMFFSLKDGARKVDLQSVSGDLTVEVDNPAKAALHSLSGQFILGQDVRQAADCLSVTASSVSGNLVVKGRENND